MHLRPISSTLSAKKSAHLKERVGAPAAGHTDRMEVDTGVFYFIFRMWQRFFLVGSFFFFFALVRVALTALKEDSLGFPRDHMTRNGLEDMEAEGDSVMHHTGPSEVGFLYLVCFHPRSQSCNKCTCARNL